MKPVKLVLKEMTDKTQDRDGGFCVDASFSDQTKGGALTERQVRVLMQSKCRRVAAAASSARYLFGRKKFHGHLHVGRRAKPKEGGG